MRNVLEMKINCRMRFIFSLFRCNDTHAESSVDCFFLLRLILSFMVCVWLGFFFSQSLDLCCFFSHFSQFHVNFQNASSFFSTLFIQSKWDLQQKDEILAETFNGKRCTSMKINSRVDCVLLAYQLMFYMNALKRKRALFGAHALICTEVQNSGTFHFRIRFDTICSLHWHSILSVLCYIEATICVHCDRSCQLHIPHLLISSTKCGTFFLSLPPFQYTDSHLFCKQLMFRLIWKSHWFSTTHEKPQCQSNKWKWIWYKKRAQTATI